MIGYRKFAVAVSAIASASICVGFGWIDGTQYVTVVVAAVGIFAYANSQRKVTP